jgi:copper(I)-binding protein
LSFSTKPLFLAFLTATIPFIASAETILVNGAYVRASSKMAKSAAAFMEIKNTSSQDDRLLDVKSKVAKRVELHTHIKSDDGVMKMRRVDDGFLISGNDTLRLERGGRHIMFMGLSQPFVNGESILITLFFESAGPLDLEIPIKMKERSTIKSHSHSHSHSKPHTHSHTHSD